MQENEMFAQIEEQNNDEYQVIVTGITWSKNTLGKFRSKKDFSDKLPEQMTFVLPDNIIEKEGKPGFEDEVETFIYNLLAKRFNHEAYHCQIWLPCEEQSL